MKLDLHPGIGHSPSEMETHGGMAHFANTGPIGATCGDCSYYRRGSCEKYKEMMRRGGARFPKETSACKFFRTDKFEVRRIDAAKTEPLFGDLPCQIKADRA